MSFDSISSFETLQKSIRYDFYTGRWFHYLVRSNGIQEVFSSDLATHMKQYAAYRNWTWVSDSVFLGAILIAAVACVSRSPFPFLMSLLLFTVFKYIGNIQKERLISLSSALLRNQFAPADFQVMSLFQISERLSRRYGIFSLVDAISMSDNYLRKLFLAGYVLPWPDVGHSLLVFCVVYFFCKYGLNTAVVYECIRKRCHHRVKNPQLTG
ncbi:MAG: hypothetical protein WC450_04865 [Candidatus Omnitrophota bacterium]|jgi:hypothetical protein